MPVDWRLTRTNDNLVDDDLLDVHLVDAINRFAREATATFDDPQAEKAGMYPAYEPVELEYRIQSLSTGWVRRFAGYAVETDETEEETDVGILSYDALLRERTLNRGYDAQPVSFILADLLSDSELTPVQWVSGNVTVPNDPEISRVYEGERLDVVLDELASIATSGESAEWGATLDNEFFFRPREMSASPRDFEQGDHWDLEIKQTSKEEATRSRVYYGEGSERDAVQVDDGGRQADAQDRLGTADPVIEPVEKHYPQIDNSDAARKKAEDLQSIHSEDAYVTLSTYEALGVEPGDVAHLTDEGVGIDTTVRIAQIEYFWKDDETNVRAAENSEGVLDTLVKVSDEVSRLDARGIDATAVADQVQALGDDVDIDVELKVWRNDFEDPDGYVAPAGNQVDFVMTSYSAPANDSVDAEIESAPSESDSVLIIDQ